MPPKVITMTKKQRKLVIDNFALMQYFVGRKKKASEIPRYLEDDFISDTALSFCVSAIKYDAELGYKFSTYAYGGFNMGWKNLHTRTKGKYERENFCSIETIKFVTDKLLEDAPRPKHFDRETLCRVIDRANLTWREMRVLEYYYFGDYSMNGMGRIFAVTGSRVRQVMQKALRKLKRSMDANRLTFEDFYVR